MSASRKLRGPRGVALLLALVAACQDKTASNGESVVVAHATPETRAATAARGVAVFQPASQCRVDHGGMFLDLGTDASHARRSYALGPFTDVATDTWSDQSYTRFAAPLVHYDFWLGEPVEHIELRVRAKAGRSSSLSVSVDQTRLGTVRVGGDAFQTLVFPGLKAPLGPGRHQLGLRWSGRGATDGRAYGMVEWIHWATPGQAAPQYRPPRERSLVDDVVLGGAPRHAIVLEAPGTLSCPLLVTRGSKLELGLGHSGEGSGVATVVAHRDGAKPHLLAERRVTGNAAWTDLAIELDPLAGQLVQLELNARGDSRSGRLVFSEPRVVSATDPKPPARARLAVLVVASGLHRELLPPFGGTERLRHLHRLAEESARFSEYRVPTTVVGGVFATLLSGLPPVAHQLESSKARLPDRVQTLADRIRETSGESAFFTGVPHTRAAFGFERGWHNFESFSPVDDVSAAAPLTRAKTWIEQSLERDPDVPRLVVIHLRGGHPPWDLSRQEVAELEPREYHGLLEARRGGIVLSNIRSHSRLAQRRLTAPDWVRLRALQMAALKKQDEALGSLIELLERTNVWDQTLFAFAGDVASGDPPEAPFGAERALTEDRLLVPLWIKFPEKRSPARSVSTPVSSPDVTSTLAQALGIVLPDELSGPSLYHLAQGHEPPAGRRLLSTLGPSYALRWGQWLLRGTSPKAPTLCELSVDPACAHDVLEQSPLAAESMWRATFEEHKRQQVLESASGPPEPALLDKDTAAALQVWGD